MKKAIFFTAISAIILFSNPTQAATKVGSEYSNCAYKGKKASKKCLVTFFKVSPSFDRITESIYGSGGEENLDLIVIEWPDKDISRYLAVGLGDYVNLNNKDNIRYKSVIDTTGKLHFMIPRTRQSHVELWY